MNTFVCVPVYYKESKISKKLPVRSFVNVIEGVKSVFVVAYPILMVVVDFS